MHTLLGLSSLLLLVFGGALALGALRRLNNWAQRRDLQLLILAAPLVSLVLGLGELHHFAGRTCFLGAPPWDYTVGMVLPLGMGVVAFGGISLGVIRLGIMAWVIAQRGALASWELQAVADGLAERLGIVPAQLLICAYDRPLALTIGVWRPRILLSTWMIAHLDRGELEAVLAHELSHVARRDYLMIWLATVLRDAFWYLPTSWVAYRQLQHEKELACDDLAVAMTKRRLALASALAKVWQQVIEEPHVGVAQPLVGAAGSIEGRITRLLAPSDPTANLPSSRIVTLCVGVAALAGLVVLQATNVALMLVPMGCGPMAPLWRLF